MSDGDPIESVYVDASVEQYLRDILAATREPRAHGLAALDGALEAGAPEADFERILRLAKEKAHRADRGYLLPDDVRQAARATLELTLIPSRQAEAQGHGSEDLVQTILDSIEVP